MLEILVPRIEHDIKYQAKDGQFFENKDNCIRHEQELDFASFVLDEKKVQGPITEENWQHCVYDLLNQFYNNPIKHAFLLQKENYSRNDWKKNEKTNEYETVIIEFDITQVKILFLEAFKEVYNYREIFIDRMRHDRNNYQRINISNLESHTGSYVGCKFKLDTPLENIYKFILDKKLLSLEDLLEDFKKTIYTTKYNRLSGKSEERKLTLEEIHNSFSLTHFHNCFNANCTTSLDIAIKNLNLNLMFCLNYITTGSYGGDINNTLRADFFTRLCCFRFTYKSNYSNTIISADDTKRIKWIKYLIEKNISLKLFKYYYSYDEMHNNEIDFKTNSNVIYLTIDDLIKNVEREADNHKVFLFQKTSKEIISLLRGITNNIFTTNKKNKKPYSYFVLEKAFHEVVEKLSDYPELNIVVDRDNFSIIRIIEENKSYELNKHNEYRNFKQIEAQFHLSLFNARQHYAGHDKTKVKDEITIHYTSKEDRYDSKKDSALRTRLFINDYKNKEDKLISEIIFQLNDKNPLGQDGLQKIKSLEETLLQMEKQKEKLLEEKETLERLIPKKKK